MKTISDETVRHPANPRKSGASYKNHDFPTLITYDDGVSPRGTDDEEYC